MELRWDRGNRLSQPQHAPAKVQDSEKVSVEKPWFTLASYPAGGGCTPQQTMADDSFMARPSAHPFAGVGDVQESPNPLVAIRTVGGSVVLIDEFHIKSILP